MPVDRDSPHRMFQVEIVTKLSLLARSQEFKSCRMGRRLSGLMMGINTFV